MFNIVKLKYQLNLLKNTLLLYKKVIFYLKKKFFNVYFVIV
jgi:hypothetical protein